MKKQTDKTVNQKAGNAGNTNDTEFKIGENVVFRQGLARETFGKGPFTVVSDVYKDDLGEPCVKISDSKCSISAFPIAYLQAVPKVRTDEQILQGLKCCANPCDCERCPYDSVETVCVALLLKDVLGLVERQQENLSKKDRENEIYLHLTNYLASKITCSDCILKNVCLQLENYKKKDNDKDEDVAGCWAMWYQYIEHLLEEENVIEKKPYKEKIRIVEEENARRKAKRMKQEK